MQLWGREWPARILLSPESFGHAAGRCLHILEGEDMVFRNVATHHAAFREGDGQGRCGPRCSGVVDEPIRAETTDAVEALTSFQVTLGNCDHLANGPANGGHCRV